MVSENFEIADTCETHGLKDCPSCPKTVRGNSPLLIAEIGQNFCGSMDLAKQLIRLAKENGADLVKLQLYDHKILYACHTEIPDVALSFDQAKMLFDYGKEVGIEVFFSVFDVERVKWCEEIGVKRYKIACSFRDKEVLDAIRNTQKPVIISGNSSTFYWRQASWLYCVPEYPARITEMPYFNHHLYNKWLGFSDHIIGLDAAKIALARGATIIEKHFALDHQTGVDAAWSMNPDELKELVRFSKVVNEVL